MELSMRLATLGVAAALIAGTQTVAAADADSAQAFMKKERCGACHVLDKKKDGPSLKDISAKHKGKVDAEASLVQHILSGPMVEMDGVKEAHRKPKSTDQAQIKNVVQYILSL